MRPAIVTLVCLSLSGCFYQEFDHWDELDTVITLQRPNHDFSDYETYAMPESVADLSDLIDDPVELGDRYDEDIVDGLADHFAEMGWTRVGDLEDADVLVLTGKVAGENLAYYSWWYPYYPYYIYYPPQTVTVSYTSGSILTVMLKHDDVEVIDDIESVPAIWAFGTLALLYDDSNKSVEERIELTQDEAFAQSEYLRVGDAVDPIHNLDVDLPGVDESRRAGVGGGR